MKYSSIAFLTFLFVLGIPSCCADFILITGIEKIRFYDAANFVAIDGGDVETDSLHMEVYFQYDSFTEIIIPGTMSSALAFSCDEGPVANWIDQMVITSNSDFNDIPAGNSLNDKFEVQQYGTIEAFLDNYRGSSYSYYYLVNLRFKEKPVIPDHVFTIDLVDNSGNNFTSSSQPLSWK